MVTLILCNGFDVQLTTILSKLSKNQINVKYCEIFGQKTQTGESPLLSISVFPI